MDMHIYHRSIRVLWPLLHNELNMSGVSQMVCSDYLLAARAACFPYETLICSPSQFGGEGSFFQRIGRAVEAPDLLDVRMHSCPRRAKRLQTNRAKYVSQCGVETDV